MLGIWLSLRGDVHHTIVFHRGTIVLARVLQQRIGTSKLLSTVVDRTNKRLFTGMSTHVTNDLVVLVEWLLLHDAVLPFAGVLRLEGEGGFKMEHVSHMVHFTMRGVCMSFIVSIPCQDQCAALPHGSLASLVR